MESARVDIALEAKSLSQYDLLRQEAEEILQLIQKISVDPEKHSIQKTWLDIKYHLENRTIGENLSNEMAETVLAIRKSRPTETDMNDFFIQSRIVDKLIQFNKNVADAYTKARNAINGEGKATPASGQCIGLDESMPFYTRFFEDIDKNYFKGVNNFYDLFASSRYFSARSSQDAHAITRAQNAHAITSFCGAVINVTTPEQKLTISARDAQQRLAEQNKPDRPEAIIDHLRRTYTKKEKDGVSKDIQLENFSDMPSAALDYSRNVLKNVEDHVKMFKMRQKMEADICSMRKDYIALNKRYIKKCFSSAHRSAEMQKVESKADAFVAKMRQFSNEYFDNLAQPDPEKIAEIFIEYDRACLASYNSYLENRIAAAPPLRQALRNPLEGVIQTADGKIVPLKSLMGKKVFISYMRDTLNASGAASKKLESYHELLGNNKKYISAERYFVKSCLKYAACFAGVIMMLTGVLAPLGVKLVKKFQPGKTSQGGLFAQSAEKSKKLKTLADSQMECSEGRHLPL